MPELLKLASLLQSANKAAPGRSAEELIPCTDPVGISEAQHAASKLQRLAEALPGTVARKVEMQAVQQHMTAATAEAQQQLADTRQAICELQERESIKGALDSVRCAATRLEALAAARPAHAADEDTLRVQLQALFDEYNQATRNMEWMHAQIRQQRAGAFARQGRIERRSSGSGSSGSDSNGDADVSSTRWLPSGGSGDVSRSSLRTPALMSARVRTPSTYRPAKFGTYADDS
ncbi:hypothetical protein COCSUDRAFT_58292 [Coccomyxa subellipsoidea C-169]|uniref:Uncharacterized protein n=1 Tax=Coccomyxa subellipsoidea (strain C-169) TaxID=574566 RepID=I0YMC5_COCSC|nr:hypothetical protein COCSUDRAFT_58292 [Coccomyxa subellipsoidea C-169]EIE19544.1 hypothetical protein COCSUDRAFT_58292 [Coccomyxa subellipsoidea C-169]|eukprot:XP_005644088.1 hypothetical protein COCSUDRAFT_58292 [Coccomyxa subellipsoidea C-169]